MQAFMPEVKCKHKKLVGEDEIVELRQLGLGRQVETVECSKIQLLVRCLATNLPFKFEASNRNMNLIRTIERASFQSIIQAFHWREKTRVLNGCPWWLNQHLFVPKENQHR